MQNNAARLKTINLIKLLNNNQISALLLLRDEKAIGVGSGKVNSRTMYSLYVRKLIKCPRYANGEFWELTDLGISTIVLLVKDFSARTNVERYSKAHCKHFCPGLHKCDCYTGVTGN